MKSIYDSFKDRSPEARHRFVLHRASFIRRYINELTPGEVQEMIAEVAPFIADYPPEDQEAMMDLFNSHPADSPPTPPFMSNEDMRSFQKHDAFINKAQNPPNTYKPGVVARSVNKMTPRARGLWKATMGMVDTSVKTGKLGPFMPATVEEISRQFGADPNKLRELHRAQEREQVQAGLFKRMGTDLDRKPDPISLRETISASVDYHESQNAPADYGGSSGSENASSTAPSAGGRDV